MAAEFLNIPLNLKQRHSIFVIDPSNIMHSATVDKSSITKLLTNMSTLMFSFKSNIASANSKTNGNKALISICPKSFINSFANDISYKLLYEYTKPDNSNLYINARTNINDLFNEIPAIQIRLYSLNARINLAMSLFSALIDGFNEGTSDANTDINSISIKLEALWDTFTLLIGVGEDSAGKDFATKLTTAFKNANSKSDFEKMMNSSSLEDKEFVSIYTMPWTMYYAMITSFSSNIYEFPFNGQFKFSANGGTGWNNAGITGAQFGSQSAFFSFINLYLKNIKFDFTPTWDGNAETTPSILVTIDLFNDNVDSSINNFILINTLIPSAMSMQYNVFLNSPDLYDIKIKGIERLFMCSGSFNCEYKGVIRRPPAAFFEKLKSHLHPLHNTSNFMQQLIDNDVIRIPDIYTLTLDFNSLMPNNFNNYIYKYCMNNNIELMSGKDMAKHSDGLDVMDKLWKEISKQYDDNEKNLAQLAKDELAAMKAKSDAAKAKSDAAWDAKRESDKKDGTNLNRKYNLTPGS